MPRDTQKPLSSRSKEVQQAIRAEKVAIIVELLTTERRTSPELSRLTKTDPNTLNGYLRYMQQTLRLVRPTTMRRAKSTLWELGADPNVPSEDDVLDRLIAPKRGIHPARQIGMWRHPMDVAFFGPARAVTE